MRTSIDIPSIPFREARALWWKLGWLSFGGPAGQIALMHRMLVEKKRWIDETRFLHALNYCMLLPGPEAMQLATYIGWLLHGVRGGVVAGLLFILPGALCILALSWLYVLLSDLSVVQGLFFGLKAAVLAIVLQALLRIAARILGGVLKPLLALAALVALFAFNLPFPLVVLGAGLIGWLTCLSHHAPTRSADSSVPVLDEFEVVVRPGTRRAALFCLVLWGLTVSLLFGTLGGASVFVQIATFFSKMAVVTFGGAYAVLAYVAQQGVEHYTWLQPGEMLDGLGLAETTPGPLILVTQFVGFLGAMRHAGMEQALLAGTLGALLTTWITFLPCFLWIFLGAPYIERLRAHRGLVTAMTAITAAVVGVIANLALWFALNFLFAERIHLTGYGLDMQLPVLGSYNPAACVLAVFGMLLLFVFRLGIFAVLGLCAWVGMGWWWLA